MFSLLPYQPSASNNEGKRTLIRSWKEFGRVVRPRQGLLRCLPEYPRSIFVSGCQRSGGTMLCREIAKHPDVVDFAWSKDAELDGALLLSGNVPNPHKHERSGRYCFQTTYLNDQYTEYSGYAGTFKLVWLLRNHRSVVFSMLYNWKRFALDELFLSCGLPEAPREVHERLERGGLWRISALERACYSYIAKAKQAMTLLETLPGEDMRLVDYENLVKHRAQVLAELYDFLGLRQIAHRDEIHSRSLAKADRLSDKQKRATDRLCSRHFEMLRSCAS